MINETLAVYFKCKKIGSAEKSVVNMSAEIQPKKI